MENFKQSILMMVLLVFTVLINSCSSDHTLIRNGESEYKIYVSKHATVPEQFAAREFKKYMKEITGCNLSIVHKAEVGARLIYIGFEDVPGELLAGLHKEKFGKEEYVIRKSGKNMLIAGGRPRGTLYGVGYLQDLGCRWYTREVTKVPRQPTIFLPTGEKRRQPVFEYREAWYKEAYDTEWAVHNRLNPSIVPIPDSLGGSYIVYPFGHTFYQLVPPEKEFDVSARYKGKRNRQISWVEYENPVSGYVDFEKLFRNSEAGVAYARRIFNIDKQGAVSVGIGSNDGVRMWLNRKVVLDHKVLRKAEPNQEILTLPFKKGDNIVLIKIDQAGGGWGFYFSILDHWLKLTVIGVISTDFSSVPLKEPRILI